MVSQGHYFQGGWDVEFVGGLDQKHECPICLLCQREPHQTSCGHRFCHSCIITWLEDGKTCPGDNSTLGEGEIFPDTIANREILQLLVRCPNEGCGQEFRLGDLEVHLSNCAYTEEKDLPFCPSCGELVASPSLSSHQQLVCPNSRVACLFHTIGCSTPLMRKELKNHLASQMVHHMQLLADKMAKVQQIKSAEEIAECALEESEGSSSLPGSPSLQREHRMRLSGSNLHNNSRLLRELYQRVVSLEQRNCQQEIRLGQLEQRLASLELADDPSDHPLGRQCNGHFVWRIPAFSSLHSKMRNNHAFVLWSRGFYSSVFGYRFCIRASITFNSGEEHLGVFLHLMKGENDDCLSWPFRGHMQLTLVNQGDGLIRENFSETMASSPEVSAFKRPEDGRNNRGFGFQEFIRVNSLYTNGFICPQEDSLVVKVFVHSNLD